MKSSAWEDGGNAAGSLFKSGKIQIVGRLLKKANCKNLAHSIYCFIARTYISRLVTQAEPF